MSIAKILALGEWIEKIANKDSVLYLWATSPLLPEALKVMATWGFTYKSHAIWDKGIPGMGYWWRGQHELLLVGTKGGFSPPAPEHRTASVFRGGRGEHSAKPDAIRYAIAKWYPDAQKVELFARRDPASLFDLQGWDVWGNEIASDIMP